MKNVTKIATKPANYSVDDMYAYYIKKLLDENPHYVIRGKSRTGETTRFSTVYHYFDNELKHVESQIYRKKKELNELLDEERTILILNEISDIEVAIKAFEIKRKELLLKSKSVKKIIDYSKFKQILAVYNKRAGDKIIEGKKVNLLNGLGYLVAKRVERNFNNKAVNWVETDKLRDENGELPIRDGKKVMIYFIDEDWCRVAWVKTTAIRNISVYSFVPSGGQKGKGFRQAFSKALKDNPLLMLSFEYYPRK